MAIYHLSVKKLSRKAGMNAVRRAAYIMHASYTNARTGLTYSEEWRKGEIINMRSWSPKGEELDTEELWSAAEMAEKRKDAGVARSVILALPRELELEDQAAATWRLMSHIRTTYGVAISGSIHRDPENPHAHLLFTTREYDDATGTLTAKTRQLDRKNTSWREIRNIRHEWAEICNSYLDKENHISELSLKARGINRKPNEHLGPARWYIRKRQAAELAAINRELEKLEEAQTHGGIHASGAGRHPRSRPGGSYETATRGRGPALEAGGRAPRDTGRPAAGTGVPAAGASRPRDGSGTAAVRRRDTIAGRVQDMAQEARGLAARWRLILDQRAAKSRRKEAYDNHADDQRLKE